MINTPAQTTRLTSKRSFAEVRFKIIVVAIVLVLANLMQKYPIVSTASSSHYQRHSASSGDGGGDDNDDENDAVCYHLPEIVSTYTHAVKVDPEHAAMATSWQEPIVLNTGVTAGTTTNTAAIDTDTHSSVLRFPYQFNMDLLHKAFRGRRVALIGDSTLFYT